MLSAYDIPSYSGATLAEEKTWHITTPDGEDRIFRKNIFEAFPDRFANVLADRYVKTYEDSGLRTANLELLQVKEKVISLPIPLTADNDDIARVAEQRADSCKRLRKCSRLDDIHQSLVERVGYYNIKPPRLSQEISINGATNRMCDRVWWRRSLRKVFSKHYESVASSLGQVQKRKGLYVSDEAVRRRLQQIRRNRNLLESMVAINELGDQYTLAQLQDLSVSNPKIRRGELMVRIAGFELLAKKKGYQGIFLTLTCPSRMHAYSSIKSSTNPNYDETLPDDAQKYLVNLWARIRAKFDREGIKPVGIRVAEPHHDGTPHWHLLLFIDRDHTKKLIEIMRQYALLDSPNESGARKHRLKVKYINPKKGNATGYIAKYIAKNIDGFGVNISEHGQDASSAAVRANTWASIWGIRQFQQIGGPPVSVWREMRRAPELEGFMEEVRKACSSGDWAKFVGLMGGIHTRRKDHPIKLYKKYIAEPGTYGDPKGDRTIGVSFQELIIITRIHSWTIQKLQILPDTDLDTEQHLRKDYLYMGMQAEVGVAGAAPPGRSPGGGAPTTPLTAGVTMSRNLYEGRRNGPLEFCQ